MKTIIQWNFRIIQQIFVADKIFQNRPIFDVIHLNALLEMMPRKATRSLTPSISGSPCLQFLLCTSDFQGHFNALKRQIWMKRLFGNISRNVLNTLSWSWTVLNKTQSSRRTKVRPTKVKIVGSPALKIL